MNRTPELRGAASYARCIQALQEKILSSQSERLALAADLMVATLLQPGRIFLFGTGHSHLMVEEAYYRAGGLAAVVPVFSSALMLHEDPALSSRLERTGGLAAPLLDRHAPVPGEMLVIFSYSGVNQLPVEMALEAKQRRLHVVSVSSFAYAQVAPLSPSGKRLAEVSDIAIDNGGEPGDAQISFEVSNWPVAPVSTVIGAFIWNCLVAECAARLVNQGFSQDRWPFFASQNMPGAAEHNAALIENWRQLNPYY